MFNLFYSNFLLNKKILSYNECEIIKTIILKYEPYVKSLGNDYYLNTNTDSLTGRYAYFNFLSIPKINEILLPKLKKEFKNLNIKLPISIQCWANTFRYDEGIKMHVHGRSINDPYYNSKNDDFLCGNIFISGDKDIGTFYNFGKGKIKKIKNIKGKLIMFDSHMEHGVSRNPNKEIRISLAFDVYAEKMLTEDANRYYIINDY